MKYRVDVPFTGVVSVEVEAVDEKAAIDAAFESDALCLDNLVELEYVKVIVEGNIFSGVRNRIEVEEIK